MSFKMFSLAEVENIDGKCINNSMTFKHELNIPFEIVLRFLHSAG